MVICGPTASGKSRVADGIAELLTRSSGVWAPVICVDSMQVYRGIPVISNQRRERPARITGTVSVTEDWNVARHSELARKIIEESLGEGATPVLDAGTGMYLNVTILDTKLAPAVPGEIRERATEIANREGAKNPHRRIRELELELSGQGGRGSVWDAEPRYALTMIYLRPPRERLLENISRRTREIVRDGVEEARNLSEIEGEVNPSVMRAVGISEMLRLAKGEISDSQAVEEISIRTRQLARRQRQWFDKLARVLDSNRDSYALGEHLNIKTIERMPDGETTYRGDNEVDIKNYIHDIIDA